MKSFLKRHKFLLVVILIVIIGSVAYVKKSNEAPNWTTAKVESGTVSQLISISGTAEAIDTAELTFPVSGIIKSIPVKKGQKVNKGDTLMTLNHQDLLAEYKKSKNSIAIAKANQQETIAGVTNEEKNVSATKVDIAQEALARAKREQETKVTSAYRTLLSSNLIAEPTDPEEESTAPTVTGTYTCDEGTYTLDMYRSKSKSGYSYVLSGLESGTYVAYTDSASPLGDCGLFIQFDSASKYGDSKWQIKIPNTRSSSYLTNLNSYNLALTNQENTLSALEQELELAKQNLELITASPRDEVLVRDTARVSQAQSETERISSQIQDHILTAPFSGTITNIGPAVGETVGTKPVITMVADNSFEISALIPEIDITKLAIGQKAKLVFDAQSEKIIPGTIIFISPLAEIIAGVSYFETTIVTDETLPWLRGGLNADIDIIVEERQDVLRLPKRFLIEETGEYYVLTPKTETTDSGKKTTKTPVTVEFIGNDGYVAITGLNLNQTVVAP